MSDVRSYEAWQFIYSSLYTALYDHQREWWWLQWWRWWPECSAIVIAEATIWSWGQSRLLSIDVHCATPQKDSKAEIELEGWVISNVCKPIRCICTACNSNQVWFWRRQVQKTDNIVLILWWPITLTTIVIALLITILREGSGYQIGWIFEKLPRGGGGHFQSKNLCCRFWEL